MRVKRCPRLATPFRISPSKWIARANARLDRVTRAWVTQIMNLLNLAPEIQERLLFLPGRSVAGRR